MISEQEIKHINALKVKKYRNKYAEFVAEGDKIIIELLAAGLDCTHIYTNVENKALPASTKVIKDKQLAKISSLKNHHGSLAVFKIPNQTIDVKKDEWILLLDDIQDPGNMGTIIRSCDWFGVQKIICSDGCVDAYNPKVIQASMASIARVQIMEANLEEMIDQYKLPIYGAVLDGKNYHQQKFDKKGFMLIGNEGHGIRKSLLDKITYPITIPKKGKAESLNAAIATALILDKL